MLNPTLLVGGVIIWGYVLSVLKRAKKDTFYFLVGSSGLFVLLILGSKPYGVWLFSTMITWAVGLVGAVTSLFNTFDTAHVIQVVSQHQTNLMVVDYECSGIIETAAFWGLIAFYPIYTVKRRVILAIIGAACFFVANVIRLSTVATIVHFFGQSSFYLGHAIIGRLVFYVIAIFWYYFVFTKGQLVNQVLAKRG